MASTARKLQTSFTKGELSPRLEGRPDLAAFFNGCETLENYYIFPQGGVYRSPGTLFVAEVKNSAIKTRLAPFIFNRTQAYVLEIGDSYIRFYKNKARLIDGSSNPVEVATPFLAADLFQLMWAQSVDVLFFDHSSYQTRKLTRVSDTEWAMTTHAYRPPPSFEDKTDLNTTLTPAQTAGTNILFTAGAAVFLDGDEDRNIISGTARAVITTVDSSTTVHADILDPFPNTNPIAAHSWFLTLSPTSWLTPTKVKPVGGTTKLTGRDDETDGSGNKDTFRAADVGKFVPLAGGLVEITKWGGTTNVTGIIRARLSKAGSRNSNKHYPSVPPGDWLLQVNSWTAANGFPRCLIFYQGSQYHAGSFAQPTNFWGSAKDSYENYAIGSLATDAVDYPIAARQLNQIIAMADLGPLILLTPGTIWLAKAPGTDQPFGGDIVPFLKIQDAPGARAMAPLVIGTRAIYIHASGKQVYELSYNTDAFDNSFRGSDLTRLSEHIVGASGLAQDQIAYLEIPNRHVLFPRNDGQLACLTYFPIPEQVEGWSRRTTLGVVESHCVIPHPSGDRDQHWLIVKRTINGQIKRYVEVVDDDAFPSRAWKELNTDCAKIYSGAAVTNVPDHFLDHLEGSIVDVMVNDGIDKGQKTIVGGKFDTPLQETATLMEIGLHYESTLTTMRPALQDAIIEGIPRRWNSIQLRMKNSIGGRINGKLIHALKGGDPMDTAPPFLNGDTDKFSTDWDTIGKITVKQDRPYPHQILSLFGELAIGDRA